MSRHLGMVILAMLAFATSAHAGAIAGHDYVVLPVPQRQAAKGKIEVIEFFSWGCSHCNEFYPLLNRWLATLPKDVTFTRVPVDLGHPEWNTLVRAYYALQSTGDVARLDPQIFEAIHKEHVSLYDEKSITAWVEKHGVNVAKFTEAFHSFSVNTSVGRSENTVVAYRVEAIPMMGVGGRYTVARDYTKMLATSGELIAKVRAEDKKPRSPARGPRARTPDDSR
jgi:thiol:disulfide interchange protein DsbA